MRQYSKKISRKKDVKDKKFRQSRDVTIILGESIIKDVKGEPTDESDKAVVRSSRGATISQIKWHMKPTTEQNPKNVILCCGTNDINGVVELLNIAEVIVQLAKSIKKKLQQ